VRCVVGGDARKDRAEMKYAGGIYRNFGVWRGGLAACAHGLLHFWRLLLAVLLGDAVKSSW
jgi:hypothetical protein